MSHKRREQRRQKPVSDPTSVRWPEVLRSVVLSGAVALIVIGALVPSESAIPDGTYAPLAAGWCLLAVVWAASLLLDKQPRLRLGWTEAIGAALIGWHSLAAVLSIGQTNGRQAINAHWLILGYGLTAFLLRQSIRTTQQARSLVSAMIWLATLLAAVGLYQYGYSMPKLRHDYQQDRDAILRSYGISPDTDAPHRELLENRLRSVEPLATFALTNSLAGFLAPWLLATLAIGLANLRFAGQRTTLFTCAAIAAILAACLLLTKSRTAYLAVAAGLVLLGLYGRPGGWRLDWRIPAALAGAVIVIGLAAVYFGGLDMQVLSEAPKSVLYRLEYWQATARVITAHPIFGSGPGNFQEAYALYKLPQASETVADPHNFLLEMWATAGTPAVLLLVGLMAAFAIDISSLAHASEREPPDEAVAPAKWIVFGGAIAGLFLAPLVAGAVGYPLEGISPTFRSLSVVWLLGLPLLATAWWSLDDWITAGELTVSAAVIPQIVLAINLLAAGALTFPAVISTALVLGPVALFVAARHGEASHPIAPSNHVRGPAPAVAGLALSKLTAALVTLAVAALAVACFYTEYYPVLHSHLALSDALDQRTYRDAEPKAIAAANADRFSPEPWRILADLGLARWQATGDAKDRQAFVEFADGFRRLDPADHKAWFTRGNWYVTAWKKSKLEADLEEAVAAYREASRLFPSRAMYHAQLAWTLHLADQNEPARQEAERAFELDQKMPHQEQKLARQHVIDPNLTKGEERTDREESAEQTVARLRTASAEEMQ